MDVESSRREGNSYGNINIGGHARVLLGDSFGSGSVITGPADFTGAYAHSSLRPVTTYVPRPDLEQQLRDQLPLYKDDGGLGYGSRTAIVWGLGGAGKSQLALNFVHEHRRQYRAIFWVEAGQKKAIERDYLQIYKLLYPGATGESISINDAVSAVKNWLEGQEGRCLWVMDSADAIEDKESDDYIELDHYLPDTPQLDRIITTRSSRAQQMSEQKGLDVREMNEEEAAQLFLKCAGMGNARQDVVAETVKIVKELGCFALAVTLAGSYVRESPRLSADLRLYLPDYQAGRGLMLSQKANPYLHRYSESVLSTWEMSYKAVQRQSLIAARLLCLLAFLNFDDIFLELFTMSQKAPRSRTLRSSPPKQSKLSTFLSRHGVRKQPAPQVIDKPNIAVEVPWRRLLSPDGAVIDRGAIEAGFAVLRAYSLVSWRVEQKAYVMHKLVHAWGQDRLEKTARREWSLAALELLGNASDRDKRNLDVDTRLVPHVMANFSIVSTACGTSYKMTEGERDAITNVGDLLKRQGRWDDEYTLRKLVYQVTEDALGKDHPATLDRKHELASVLSRRGQYKQAIEVHRETLELQKRVLGDEHPDTLKSTNNLAIAYAKQGKYDHAEEMHRMTLDLQKKVLGPEHPETLTSMNNLALVLSDKGQHASGEQVCRKALEMQKKVLGSDHPSTLTSMNNLAFILNREGKHEQAGQMHRENIELRSKILGREHPSTLTSMTNLASALRRQGKIQQSIDLYRQTLELETKVLGAEHPYTRSTKAKISDLVKRQKRLGSGEEGRQYSEIGSSRMLSPEPRGASMQIEFSRT